MIPERWLLDSSEPWTRYRTLIDLLGRAPTDPEVIDARREMLNHPQVQGLVTRASTWEGSPFKRHNDAAHPLYALSTLADFGMQASDPGIGDLLER